MPLGSAKCRDRAKRVEMLARWTQLILEININVLKQEQPSVTNDLMILYRE